jgi:hypothetical protein
LLCGVQICRLKHYFFFADCLLACLWSFLRLCFYLLLEAPLQWEGNSFPSLPFYLELYVRLHCFFYKSNVPYFWISPGLTAYCSCLHSPAFLPYHLPFSVATHLMFCFRFMEMQPSAGMFLIHHPPSNLPHSFPDGVLLSSTDWSETGDPPECVQGLQIETTMSDFFQCFNLPAF